jgi:hypothetical protein
MAAFTNLDEIRDDKGKLPSFSWPGSYPIIYLSRDGLILCPDCANKPVEEYDDPAVAYGGHLEGPPEVCEDCGKQVESAYGDPDAANDEPPA